jgi:hypothetical protein
VANAPRQSSHCRRAERSRVASKATHPTTRTGFEHGWMLEVA